jgi:hypothetical protein
MNNIWPRSTLSRSCAALRRTPIAELQAHGRACAHARPIPSDACVGRARPGPYSPDYARRRKATAGSIRRWVGGVQGREVRWVGPRSHCGGESAEAFWLRVEEARQRDQRQLLVHDNHVVCLHLRPSVRATVRGSDSLAKLLDPSALRIE